MSPLHTMMPDVEQISFEKFIELIKSGAEIPSLEVIVDGNYRFTAILPNKDGGNSIYDDIKTNAIYLALRSNTNLNPDAYNRLDETRIETGFTCHVCGFQSKSAFGLQAHERSHKRVAMKVVA